MYASKLLRTVATFTPEEVKRLGRFLRSPYFFTPPLAKEVISLWEHIERYYPDWEGPALAKERSYAVVYPGEEFVVGRVDRVMSNLLKAIREFIIFEFSDLRDQKVTRQLVLAKYYQKRKLEKYYRGVMAQLEKIQARRQKDNLFYHDQFLVDREHTLFETFFNQRNKGYNVAQTLRSLGHFYLVYRLEYFCWLLTQDRHNVPLNLRGNLLENDQILAAFKQEIDWEDEPLLKVYDMAIQLIRGDGAAGEQAYRELKRLLTLYAREIPFKALKQFHALCRNYCTREYNKSRGAFLHELFALYQEHLELGTLFYQEKLTPATLRNIVVCALRTEAYDWVAQFLEAYRDRISSTNQPQAIYRFNLANYHFALGDYERALDCLTDRYDDIYYQLAAKRMELKIYYEIDLEVLDAKIAAFKIYIYRISKKVLPAIPREGNNNFIDLLKQIRRTNTRFNLPRIQKLTEKVSTKTSIAERDWLLQKLKKLTQD